MQRTVRLAHDSFRDFLKTAECFEDFRIDDNYTPALIAAACLRYLSSVTIAPHDEIYNLDKREAALSKGHPRFSHATRHVSDHLDEVQYSRRVSQILLPAIREFFSHQGLLRWLRAILTYSDTSISYYIDEHSISVSTTIKRVLEWLQKEDLERQIGRNLSRTSRKRRHSPFSFKELVNKIFKGNSDLVEAIAVCSQPKHGSPKIRKIA